MKQIGFIGAGNMGHAMLKGILNSKKRTPSQISVIDSYAPTLKKISSEIPGIDLCNSLTELVEKADIIFLAVKPQGYKSVVREIADTVTKEKIIVTIAAGITLDQMEQWFEKPVKTVRTMPNTPAQVGEGMTAYCANALVSDSEKSLIEELFGCFGRIIPLPEKNINGFTALAGSSPAWVFMFIEALADGAVLMGMPRAVSYEAAAQALLGSAKMVLETGKHPGELKDTVCSPGGTTIEALASLEKNGFRSSVIEAFRACTEKAERLS